MNIDNQAVYLDANFLIYWFISKEPELKKQARLILANLLADRKKIYASALVFDEAWLGIRKEYNEQKSVKLSCSDDLVFTKLKNFTNLILPKLNLIQLANVHNGIIEALDYIKTFGLRPRDAFHLATMKHNNIAIIVTNDSDFINKQQPMDIFVQSIF